MLMDQIFFLFISYLEISPEKLIIATIIFFRNSTVSMEIHDRLMQNYTPNFFKIGLVVKKIKVFQTVRMTD